ncbi:MAG: uL14 family ribosomal protein [Nanoarchaeota archaeon]
MKSVKSRISRGLPIGAQLVCCDNSGAKIVEIIAVMHFKARTNKLGCGGIGELISVAVKAGKQDMMHKVAPAIIVRQKKEFTRPDGTKVKFEDNAAVILKDIKLGTPKGTLIKGPIAKEVAIRWTAVAKLATMIL